MRTNLLNTVTLSEFTDLVEKDFITFQQMVKPVAAQLFIERSMEAHTGDSRRFDEVDTETYAKLKREGENAKKGSVGIGYNKTMYAKRIALEIDITWEMRRYNKKEQVVALLTSLKHYCPQRMELDLTHRLTFCTSTSYTDMDGQTVDVTGGDGLAVVYSAHTLKFSSTTWRNRVSGDPTFSKSALESAELLARTNILSNFGERRVMNFNTIISTDDPGTVNDIKQFLKSTSEVGQTNPGVINVYQNKYRHVILPYLATTAVGAYDSTKRQWWGIVAAGQGILGWQAYFGIWEAPNLKTPKEGNNGEDFHNDNWTYGTRASYGIVVVSGRGLIMSCPSS